MRNLGERFALRLGDRHDRAGSARSVHAVRNPVEAVDSPRRPRSSGSSGGSASLELQLSQRRSPFGHRSPQTGHACNRSGARRSAAAMFSRSLLTAPQSLSGQINRQAMRTPSTSQNHQGTLTGRSSGVRRGAPVRRGGRRPDADRDARIPTRRRTARTSLFRAARPRTATSRVRGSAVALRRPYASLDQSPG